MLGRLAIAAGIALALPANALAIAGGATGGGGGGFSGGGGSFGGGSGSSCTGDDCELGVVGLLVVVAIIGGIIGLAYLAAAIAKYRRARRAKETEAAAGAANLDDGYWDPAGLRERVEECFFPIQRSWEARDVESSRPYVSDALYERHRLQLEGLEQQGRRNRIQGLKLDTVDLIRIHNVTDDGEDRFVAYIECRASDWVEEVATGKMVNGAKTESAFKQFWSFSRHPEHGWVLDEIQQATEGGYHLKAALVNQDEGPRIDEQPATATP
ncbi:MAG TPA: Tim44-like domain-containing protein [Thermoleophilaceae bacterium]|nr:Tim44-like domain-containing protein [Thermoleophilaceae bacterium]